MEQSFTYQQLSSLSKQYGEAFYTLDVEQFKRNFTELKQAFSSIYPQFNIAYSYKTNYIPRLGQAVDSLGGFAEVVSDMEIDIARHAGVRAEKIIFNGPYKKSSAVNDLLLDGGTVNIDSIYELDNIRLLAIEHPEKTINLGIRVNFAINDGVLSRFGFDVEFEEFQQVLKFMTSLPNIHLVGLHCHFATRSLETWAPRAKGMLKLIDSLGLIPEHIDIGGGLYGKMAAELATQFPAKIPKYTEYAEAVATVFADHYGSTPSDKRPLLLIEPGSALVGDCMSLITTVKSIKNVRGKAIATLLASMYNINMGKKNPPMKVVAKHDAEHRAYNDLDFAGFTCIESDYLYRGYSGQLAVGDYVVFSNVGSYSIVFKPPFILPNFAVVEVHENGSVETIKRAETYDDLFQTYTF